MTEMWARLVESVMQGSRSTALKALLYLDALTLSALVVGSAFRAPTWILVLIGAAFAIAFLFTLFAYGFFMFKDPSALRSEKFVIDKLAIEKGLVGDNVVGLSAVAPTRIGRHEGQPISGALE